MPRAAIPAGGGLQFLRLSPVERLTIEHMIPQGVFKVCGLAILNIQANQLLPALAGLLLEFVHVYLPRVDNPQKNREDPRERGENEQVHA